MKKKNVSKNLFVLSILIFPLILFCIFYIGVNLNSFIMAFQEWSWTPEGTKVTWAGFSNFRRYFTDLFSGGTIVSIAFKNSVLFYLITLVIGFPLTILFAYLLYKKCFFNKTIRAIVMIPQVVSGFVICLLFKKIIGGDGPIAYLVAEITGGSLPNFLRDQDINFGIIVFYSIWTSFSTGLIVYPNAMKDIPDEVMESARLDGVTNMFQELWYMVLPLIFPTISTFLITGVAGIFLSAGPLVEFYKFDAPGNVYLVGYYYTQQIMTAGDNTSGYPYLAAGGLVLTFFSLIITYTVRFFLNRAEKKLEA